MYSTCVTLAEVNERGVTVTEEFVIMIPASPWACVRVRGTQSLNFLCLCSKTCLSFQLCKRYAGETVGGGRAVPSCSWPPPETAPRGLSFITCTHAVQRLKERSR